MCWSLYNKSGGDDDSRVAFSVVKDLLNSPGGKRGQGVLDMALANNIQLAQYLKQNWGAQEQLSPPKRDSRR